METAHASSLIIPFSSAILFDDLFFKIAVQFLEIYNKKKSNKPISNNNRNKSAIEINFSKRV